MLKPRTLVILAAVLVLLVAVKTLQDCSHEREVSGPGVATLIPEPLAAEDLGSIAVGYGTDSEVVVLENQPDGWRVATAWNAHANKQRVDALLRALGGLTAEFRSDSPEVLADYGFTDSTAVTVTGRDRNGDEVFALEVGRRPTGATGQFVRRPGANAVYLTNESILSTLGVYGQDPERPKSRHFLELQAVKLDRQEVDAVTVRSDGTEIALQKEFEEPAPLPADSARTDTTAVPAGPDRSVWEWRMVEPRRQPAAKTKADALLGAVTNIHAVDVADPSQPLADYGLEEPERTVQIALADADDVTLAFGATREAVDDAPKGVYMRVDDDPTIWVASDYVLKNIFKQPDELLPESE
jgi:hypothetical protein